MTGGPRLDREDLEIAGGGERPNLEERVRGNNQRWRGAGRPSQPGSCLGSTGPTRNRPGLGPCLRLGSPESVRALFSQRVTAAADSPAR